MSTGLTQTALLKIREEMAAIVSAHCIRGVRATLILRKPNDADAEAVITDDDLREVAAAIERAQRRQRP